MKKITPSELRLGNIICENFSGYKRITEITPMQVCAKSLKGDSEIHKYDYENIRPVKLNAEIFEQLGFIKSPIAGNFEFFITTDAGSSGGLTVIWDAEDFSVSIGVNEPEHYSHCFGRYEYLHELQNLIFCISARELLIVNLP